jgi:hypothetical protein
MTSDEPVRLAQAAYLIGDPSRPLDVDSLRLRAPLLWLDQADPCDTVRKVKEEDPRLLALATVMAHWRHKIGVGHGKTVQEVINCAINASDFQVALLNVASSRSSNVVSNDRLGRWLKRNQGRIVNGLALRCVNRSLGYPIWSLVPA